MSHNYINITNIKNYLFFLINNNNPGIAGTITVKTINILIIIIVQKPLKILVHIINNKNAIKPVVRFQSLIAHIELLYQFITAVIKLLQLLTSSLILSKIITLASTAIPMFSIIAPIADKDKTTQNNLINHHKTIKNIIKDNKVTKAYINQ
jgi:hypothetical protein